MCLLVSLSERSRIRILVLGTLLVCGLQPHEETFHPPSSAYTPIGSVRSCESPVGQPMDGSVFPFE